MEHNLDATLPAIEANVADRTTFLRKVYSLLLLGVLSFAATMFAVGEVAAVRELAIKLNNLTAGRWGTIAYLGITLGAFWLVHAVAAVRVVNVVAYFGLTFLMGLLWSPMVLSAAHNAPETLNTAVTVTALMFTGLSAFVLLTGKDFGFLKGALFLGMWGLFIFGVGGAIFGFGGGLIYSVLGTLLFSGYILYDTSNILRRYPTNMAVSAAVALFTDVIYLFIHVLRLLSSRD